jgi:hypothetical protein
MILTDDKGRPFVKPSRADFASGVDYLRAFYAYKDAVASCANDSFDAAFKKAIKP